MTFTDAGRLRAAAALAVVVLAVSSRGDAFVLAVALVVASSRLPALAVLPALVASSWRWGSTSLEALAGGQAVLGPAGWVEPTSAALAAWLAALAVVLAASGGPSAFLTAVGGMGGPARATGAPILVRRLPLLVALGAGLTAGAVVAGPAPGGQLWVRVLGAVVGALAGLGAARLRARVARAGRILDGVAVAAGIGALVAASLDAPGWSGTVDAGALGEGLAIAVGTAAPLIVAMALPAALGNRRA